MTDAGHGNGSPHQPAVAAGAVVTGTYAAAPELVVGISFITATPVEAAPTVLRSINAQVSSLPTPLKLVAGPLLITLESWSDGIHVAKWPESRLYAYGHSDADAIETLREVILEFVNSVLITNKDKELGGAVAGQWQCIGARIDTSGICHEVG